MGCIFDPAIDQAVVRLQSHYIYTFMDLHSNQQAEIIALMHRLFYYMARHRLGRIANCPQFWDLIKTYYPERLAAVTECIKSKSLPVNTTADTSEQQQLLQATRYMTVTACLLASRHRFTHPDTYRFMQLHMFMTSHYFY
jgi:hypothetical protein